jgi:hypothetical protein
VWSMGATYERYCLHLDNYSVTPDSSNKETVLWRLGTIIYCFLVALVILLIGLVENFY